MSDSNRTEGEKLFELYLASQHLRFEFEQEYAGKSQRPDYSLEWNSKPVLLDVKDFDSPARRPQGGAFDPYTRIREKIDQGRKKFKQFKDTCCALLLCNLGNPLVSLEDSRIMLGAMYGDSGFTFPVNVNTGVGDASKLKPAFLDNGKMIRPKWSKPQNTTIAAVITLSSIQPHYVLLIEAIRAHRDKSIDDCQAILERTIPDFDPNLSVPRVIVWHNAVARMPFPDDLFCGLYDSHFGVVKDKEGTFQRVTFRGSQLPKSVSPKITAPTPPSDNQ
jgi:hypothetical protein